MSRVLITVYGGIAEQADHSDFDSSGVEVVIWDLDNCEECDPDADAGSADACPDYCEDARRENFL